MSLTMHLELLEMAAKAAGHTLGPDWDCYSDGIWINGTGYGDGHLWNPLDDDGDALRLANKLGMMVFVDDLANASAAQVLDKTFASEPYGEDKNAATRRAIVRAAAQIASEPD